MPLIVRARIGKSARTRVTSNVSGTAGAAIAGVIISSLRRRVHFGEVLRQPVEQRDLERHAQRLDLDAVEDLCGEGVDQQVARVG